MSTVHQSATADKDQEQDPGEWPSWVDDDSWTIEPTWELGPDPDDEAWFAELCRVGHAGDAPADPIAPALARGVEWLRGQSAYHRCRSRRPDGRDVRSLVATAIDDVRLVLDGSGARTPGELAGMPGTPYRSVVLANVAVPREERRTRLAEALDGYADYYLALETDLGRLVALEVLRHAETAERMGSRTVEAYFDDEAAYLMAIDAMAEEAADYPGVGW